MSAMRAKMRLAQVSNNETCEVLKFTAVGPKGAYPEDGLDEDNTYAKFSPSAEITITIANPALLGKFKAGDKYYVDFTKVET